MLYYPKCVHFRLYNKLRLLTDILEVSRLFLLCATELFYFFKKIFMTFLSIRTKNIFLKIGITRAYSLVNPARVQQFPRASTHARLRDTDKNLVFETFNKDSINFRKHCSLAFIELTKNGLVDKGELFSVQTLHGRKRAPPTQISRVRSMARK